MTTPLPVASMQDGSYPRPQLMRRAWCDLSGAWEFGFGSDPDEQPSEERFDRSIVVPFPPESPASGIGDTGYHHVVWYRRSFGVAELAAAGFRGDGDRLVLHFGAVDWSADVWFNDRLVGFHRGGQTPFYFDVTDGLVVDAPNVIVVRAVDDPQDVSILRGKQDWNEEPHSIWYHRTTGIWQPVWLEAVGHIYITEVSWQSDIPSSSVELELVLNRSPMAGTWAWVALSFDGELLAEGRFRLLADTSHLRLGLNRQRNGQHYEKLLWAPDAPRLVDATITIERGGEAVDGAASYLGIRSVGTGGRHFLLNDRPIYVRSVLAQNYWPESHLAAPSALALRREIELIKELGFNAARIHQKAEDPRFLFWADRLGLMLWGETASAYEFTPRAIASLTSEWTEIVRRNRSHPSIITWVPLNESWGIQHVSHDRRQQAFSRAISDLTRALDPTRPVISNDGWEHTASDIWTIHDYDHDPARLAARFGSAEAVAEQLAGFGFAGRRTASSQPDAGEPVMLTEFGGVSYTDAEIAGSWGYSAARDAADFEARLAGLLDAVLSSPVLSGFCYTQLTDTGQETNGLLRADRTPKIPVETIRGLILGERPAPLRYLGT